MSVIKQRKSGVVIERSAVPVMDVVKAIGVGNEIIDLKELFPVNDKEIWESINYFCLNTQFDARKEVFNVAKVTFHPSTNTVELELLEISGEIYLRCVNRGKLLNPKIRTINNAFTNGLKHVVTQMVRAYKHSTPIENNLQEGNFNTAVDVNIAQRISRWCEFNDVDKQQTIKWNSKEFNIEWPCANPIISKRDKNGKDK